MAIIGEFPEFEGAFVRLAFDKGKDNLDSPIGAYALLDIGTEQILNNLNSYREITSKANLP